MIIGVLSDTHIPKKAKNLPSTVFETFKDVNHIIHAGDITSLQVIKQLEEIAPVTCVVGNIDPPELSEQFDKKKILTFGKFNIGIVHGHGKSGKTIDRILKAFQDDSVHCIIFGHSHMPYCEFHNDILLFNPGSPTDKRGNEQYSLGLIEMGETITPRLIYFS